MIIEVMEMNPQLAKGFLKSDRLEGEKLWQTISGDLNSIGPPKKDCCGWKKSNYILKSSIITI